MFNEIVIGTYLICLMSLPLKVPGLTAPIVATAEPACKVLAYDTHEIPEGEVSIFVDCSKDLEFLFRDIDDKPIMKFWTKYGEDCNGEND